MFTSQLVSYLVVILAITRTSLTAPVTTDLVPRMTDGCYMVLSPNPKTDLQVGYVGGTYKINIKFGDGARAKTDRDNAYFTTNPNLGFTYNEGDMRGCGKATENYALKALQGTNKNEVISGDMSNEWYTLLLGKDLTKAKAAYDALNKEFEDFGKQKFDKDDDAKTWAGKFVTSLKSHLST